MIVKSGFFSSFSGDKPYSADDFNTLFGDIIVPGVLGDKSSDILPFATEVEETSVNDSLVKVEVKSGRAFVENIWINYDGLGDPFYVPEADISIGSLVTYAVTLSIDRENRRANMDLIKLNTQTFTSPESIDTDSLIKTAISALDSRYMPVSLVAAGLYASSVLYFESFNLAGTEYCPYAKSNLASDVIFDGKLELDSPVPLKLGGTGINDTPMYPTQKNGWVSFPLNAKDWDKVTDYPYSMFIAGQENLYNPDSDMTKEEFLERIKDPMFAMYGTLISIPVTGSPNVFKGPRITQIYFTDNQNNISRYIYRRTCPVGGVWSDWIKVSDSTAFIPTPSEPLPVSAGGTGYSLPDNAFTNTGFIQFPLNSINPNDIPLVSYTTTIAKGYPVDNTSPLYNMTTDILASIECPKAGSIWSIITFSCAGRNPFESTTDSKGDYKRCFQIWRPSTNTGIFVRFLSNFVTDATPAWSKFYKLFDVNTPEPGIKVLFEDTFTFGYGNKNSGTVKILVNEFEGTLDIHFKTTEPRWNYVTFPNRIQFSNDNNEDEFFKIIDQYLGYVNGLTLPTVPYLYDMIDQTNNLRLDSVTQVVIRGYYVTVDFITGTGEGVFADENFCPGFETVYRPIPYRYLTDSASVTTVEEEVE